MKSEYDLVATILMTKASFYVVTEERKIYIKAFIFFNKSKDTYSENYF